MTEYEIKQIQEYLNKKFSSNKFVAKNKTSIKPIKIESNEDPDFMKKNQVVGFPTFLLISSLI